MNVSWESPAPPLSPCSLCLSSAPGKLLNFCSASISGFRMENSKTHANGFAQNSFCCSSSTCWQEIIQLPWTSAVISPSAKPRLVTAELSPDLCNFSSLEDRTAKILQCTHKGFIRPSLLSTVLTDTWG